MNNRQTPRTASTLVLFGDFSILLKLNLDLRAILQGVHRAVVAHSGDFIDHGVPELFVKLDGRRLAWLLPPPYGFLFPLQTKRLYAIIISR